MLQARTLLTWSKIKFLDPESSYSTTDGTSSPSMKSYSIGANVTF